MPRKNREERLRFCKEYYRKNREELLRKAKEYYQVHKEKIKSQHLEKKGYEGYREQKCIICQTVFKPISSKTKACSEKCRNQLARKSRIKRQQRLKERALKLVGTKCIICGTKNNLHFHEIHGKDHARNIYYVINHPEDFIVICPAHHGILHFINKPMIYNDYLRYKSKFDKLLGAMENA